MTDINKLEFLYQRMKRILLSLDNNEFILNLDIKTIDDLGESVLLLYERGILLISPATKEDLEWEILFCTINYWLLFWRGEFKTSWIVAERLIKLEKKIKNRDGISFWLCRAGLSASYYAKFQCETQFFKDKAFEKAEQLIKRSFDLYFDYKSDSKYSINGMPLIGYLLIEAAKHWNLSGLNFLSINALKQCIKENPENFISYMEKTKNPEFWFEKYNTYTWILVVERIKNKINGK